MTAWIVSSSVLLALIIGLRYLFQGKLSKKLQYSLWLLALVRLLFPFSVGVTPVSVVNVVDSIPSQTIADTNPIEITAQQSESLTPTQVTPEVPPTPQHFSIYWIWLSGSILIGLWFLLVNLRFAFQLQRTRVDYPMHHIPCPIYVCESLASPCLFGLFRPAIYLTPSVVTDETLLSHTLAHELTHYRHGDHVWSILRGLCLALHWYNPLVWCGAILSSRDSELACDESTIHTLGDEQRLPYGQTLLALTCQVPGNILLTATSMSGSFQALKSRISAIAKGGKMPKYLLFAVIAITLIIAICTFTGSTVKSGPMTQAELNKYSQYQVTWEDGSQNITSNDILALCTEGKTQTLTIQGQQDITWTTYQSDTLANFLPQCKTINSIERTYTGSFDDLALVHLQYETDQLEVRLTYNQDGLMYQIVYDKNRDIAYDMNTTTRTVQVRGEDYAFITSAITFPINIENVTSIIATVNGTSYEEAVKTLPGTKGAEDFVVYSETIRVSDAIRPTVYFFFTAKNFNGSWVLDHPYHVMLSKDFSFAGSIRTYQLGNTAFQYTLNGDFFDTGTTTWSNQAPYTTEEFIGLNGTIPDLSPDVTGTYCFHDNTFAIDKEEPANWLLKDLAPNAFPPD